MSDSFGTGETGSSGTPGKALRSHNLGLAIHRPLLVLQEIQTMFQKQKPFFTFLKDIEAVRQRNKEAEHRSFLLLIAKFKILAGMTALRHLFQLDSIIPRQKSALPMFFDLIK